MAYALRKETQGEMKDERILKRLFFKRFQSYLSASLRFHPRVNVIVGTSMYGKTAILRALRLALFNEPAGAEYYPTFEDFPGITVVKVVANDHTVEIHKRVVANKDGEAKVDWQKYIIDDGEPLKGFKKSVPDEVKEALDIHEINFQKQLDPHFILSTSGPKIARIVNEITGLEKVDTWQSTLNTMIRAVSTQVRDLGKEIKKEKTELSKYDGLDKIAPLIEEYDSIVERTTKLEDEIEELTEAVSTLDGLDPKLEQLTEVRKELERYEINDLPAKIKQVDADIEACVGYLTFEGNIQVQEEKRLKHQKDYVALLKSLKRCPFCYSKTEDINHLLEHLK